MNDYSKMSDFEINKLVAERFYSPDDVCGAFGNQVYMVFNGLENGSRPLDPCNNPSDARPILEEIWGELMSDCYAHPDDAYPTGTIWEDMCKEHSKLRAAMIVYLMMQEQPNG